MRRKLAIACMFTFMSVLYAVPITNIVYAAELESQSAAPIQIEHFDKNQSEYQIERKASEKVFKTSDELEIEYLHPMNFKNRHIDTYSMHIFESVGNIHHTDVYCGFTITRAMGFLTQNNEERDSDSLGLGYTYLLRKKKNLSKHVALALDASGGLVFYDHAFPATGRAYNFMWRVGPRVIYMPTARTSLSLGWTYMHVSNGMRSHNPGYNSGGVTLNLGWDF